MDFSLPHTHQYVADDGYRLMGPTGSGKSNIIDTLTNQPGRRGRFDSESGSSTTEVCAVRLSNHPVYRDRLVLVDTTGFDNANKPDLKIREMIINWLRKNKLLRCGKGFKLAGIIYLHQITGNRMIGSPHRIPRSCYGRPTRRNSASSCVLTKYFKL